MEEPCVRGIVWPLTHHPLLYCFLQHPCSRVRVVGGYHDPPGEAGRAFTTPATRDAPGQVPQGNGCYTHHISPSYLSSNGDTPSPVAARLISSYELLRQISQTHGYIYILSDQNDTCIGRPGPWLVAACCRTPAGGVKDLPRTQTLAGGCLLQEAPPRSCRTPAGGVKDLPGSKGCGVRNNEGKQHNEPVRPWQYSCHYSPRTKDVK